MINATELTDSKLDAVINDDMELLSTEEQSKLRAEKRRKEDESKGIPPHRVHMLLRPIVREHRGNAIELYDSLKNFAKQYGYPFDVINKAAKQIEQELDDSGRELKKGSSTHGNGHSPNTPNSKCWLVQPNGNLSPQNIAAKTLARHIKHLAYDHVAQKWLKYRGTKWKEITETAAKSEVMGAIESGTGEHGYSMAFANAMMEFLKIHLRTDGFDENSDLIPFTNGVLDLTAGELLEHSPEHKLSWCLPFRYDKNATCEPVINFLKESVSNDTDQVELLRAYTKAIITGRSDLQRYIELIGTGGTGKGTFIRLCTNLVGVNNVCNTELKRLENNRFETARLYNKRLCVISDAEKYSGDVSILKAMTGEDFLPFEEKHKQGGENFKFKGMVLIAANQEIASNDLTGGLQRRRITVRFDNKVAPTKRRNLEEEFEPYLPGVVAWALSMDDTRMKELLIDTDKHVTRVGKYNLETLKKVNPLAAWVDECLVIDAYAETQIGKKQRLTITEGENGYHETRQAIAHTEDWLFASYCDWCQSSNNKEVALRNFPGLLHDLLCNQFGLEGIEKIEKNKSGLSRFKGIRIRTENDQDLDSPLSVTSYCSKKQQNCSKTVVNEEYETVNPVKSKSLNNDGYCTEDTCCMKDTENSRESEKHSVLLSQGQVTADLPQFTADLSQPLDLLQSTGIKPNFAVSLPIDTSNSNGGTATQSAAAPNQSQQQEAIRVSEHAVTKEPACRNCKHFAVAQCRKLKCYMTLNLEPGCGGNYFQAKLGGEEIL